MQLRRLLALAAILVATAAAAPLAAGSGPEGQTAGVTVTVSPSDNLATPANVQVSGLGFAASQTITIEQCVVSGGSIQDCGVAPLAVTPSNGSGSFGPVAVSVARTFTTTNSGVADCRVQACVVGAIDLGTHEAFHHLTFAGAAATVTTKASGAIALGGQITDTATVTGVGTPTGTVTFTLYGPNDASCGRPPVFTSARPLSGGTATSAPFRPASIGTYRWRASYSGDTTHNAVSRPCNDPNESVVVTAAGTAGGGPGGAGASGRPVLSALTLAPSRFRAARSGPSIAQTPRPPVGTTLSFNLSERATVRFTVRRRTVGRRVGGRCVRRRRSNAGRRRCIRWVRVRGAISLSGTAGSNDARFRGRIGGKRLRAGSYRLNGRATDPQRNRSSLRRKRFRIVR